MNLNDFQKYVDDASPQWKADYNDLKDVFVAYTSLTE